MLAGDRGLLTTYPQAQLNRHEEADVTHVNRDFGRHCAFIASGYCLRNSNAWPRTDYRRGRGISRRSQIRRLPKALYRRLQGHLRIREDQGMP